MTDYIQFQLMKEIVFETSNRNKSHSGSFSPITLLLPKEDFNAKFSRYVVTTLISDRLFDCRTHEQN